MPGGSRYETQKAAARGAPVGRGLGVPRGRGKVTKQTPAQTPRQQQSQSSLPTPPTNKSQRIDDASLESEESGLGDDIPQSTQPERCDHSIDRRIRKARPLSPNDSLARAVSGEDEDEDTQQQSPPTQRRRQSQPASSQRPQESQVRASPSQGVLNAGDIRVSVQIVVGSNNVVISGWRQRVNAIVVNELKARAKEEADKHSTTLQRPGHLVTTILSEPVAAIAARGVKTAHLNMADVQAFELVQEEIDDLLEEGKQASLNVTVTFREGEVDTGLPANPHINTNNNAPQLRPQKESAQQRQRRQIDTHELIESATNGHVLELTTRYQCKDCTYANYNFRCFFIPKLGHLTLTTPDFAAWNEAIVAKRTTVAMPPPNVVVALAARTQKGNGKKDQELPRTEQTTVGHGTMNVYVGGAAGPAQATLDIRSSPPIFAGSEVNNLTEYVTWLEDEGRLSPVNARKCRTQFSLDGWGFQHLRAVTLEDWSDMGVPRGSRLVLIDRQKEFVAVMTRRAIQAETERRLAQQNDENGELDVDMIDIIIIIIIINVIHREAKSLREAGHFSPMSQLQI